MMQILTINAGGSSVRLEMFAGDATGLRPLAQRHFETTAVEPEHLRAVSPEAPDLIAHRIVHGGELSAPCRLDAARRAELERLSPLAPLHNPHALAWVAACEQVFGERVPQIGVFDTAFFSRLPQRARCYAIDPDWAPGLRRYGFHGLAHQAMWQAWRAAEPGGGRLITLQLGSGCSIAAIENGRPLDTSMGFTPLEGLVMATRSGDIDPGLLLYLQRQHGWSAGHVQRLLSEQSGLLGVSGLSGDMRELLASDEARARLAVELYCYRASKYIGAYLTVLQGADAIAFGGGVGEHSAEIRARIMAPLNWLGVHLDEWANQRTDGAMACISRDGSRIKIWVLPVNEAETLARQAWELARAEDQLDSMP